MMMKKRLVPSSLDPHSVRVRKYSPVHYDPSMIKEKTGRISEPFISRAGRWIGAFALTIA
jgi:hypothetical protein